MKINNGTTPKSYFAETHPVYKLCGLSKNKQNDVFEIDPIIIKGLIKGLITN